MIRKHSKKRAKQMRLYSKIRDKFLEENPLCQAGLPSCTHTATEVHHQQGRTGDRLTDVANFLAVCHHCHDIITFESIMSIKNGYSKSRLNKVL